MKKEYTVMFTTVVEDTDVESASTLARIIEDLSKAGYEVAVERREASAQSAVGDPFAFLDSVIGSDIPPAKEVPIIELVQNPATDRESKFDHPITYIEALKDLKGVFGTYSAMARGLPTGYKSSKNKYLTSDAVRNWCVGKNLPTGPSVANLAKLYRKTFNVDAEIVVPDSYKEAVYNGTFKVDPVFQS